jgi:hypothetical protein
MGPSPSNVPVGRGSELSEVERFLESARPGRALVLRGEPGIGKSTVWEAGVAVAPSLGYDALSARPNEAEAQLSFAGLADLLEGVDWGVLDELPAPRRHALEVAVRRVESAGRPPEPLAIAAGVLGALRLLAGRERLLVAIDDRPCAWRSARTIAAAAGVAGGV